MVRLSDDHRDICVRTVSSIVHSNAEKCGCRSWKRLLARTSGVKVKEAESPLLPIVSECLSSEPRSFKMVSNCASPAVRAGLRLDNSVDRNNSERTSSCPASRK